jgi:hypothetical protein
MLKEISRTRAIPLDEIIRLLWKQPPPGAVAFNRSSVTSPLPGRVEMLDSAKTG